MDLLRVKVRNLCFVDDFIRIWTIFDKHRSMPSFSSYSLYVFIRVYKPESISIMSIDDGWLAFVVLDAIKRASYTPKMINYYQTSIDSSALTRSLIQEFPTLRVQVGNLTHLDHSDPADFLCISGPHSKEFASWYIQLVEKSKYVFIHNIPVSEEYFKCRESLSHWDINNIHFGGEPLVIYDWLRSRGYYYTKNVRWYDLKFAGSKLESENYFHCDWTHKDPSKSQELYWGQLEQEYMDCDILTTVKRGSLDAGSKLFEIQNCRSVLFVV